MQSKELSQFELPISRQPQSAHVDDSTVARQPNALAAINLCISVSGLEDKELYLPLGIDPGHWTRIRRGDAHFPTNKEDDLMDLAGNEVPLRWRAQKRGYGLTPLLNEYQRRIKELEEQNARLQQENDAVVRFMRRVDGR